MRRGVLALLLAAGALATAAPAPAPDASLSMVEIIDKVRTQAATQLGRRKADVETTRSLFAQGLDELDLVELVMALEESFKVPIPDAELAPVDDKDGFKKITVQRLAEVVAAQLHVKP